MRTTALHLAYQWFGSAWPIFMDEVIALTGGIASIAP